MAHRGHTYPVHFRRDFNLNAANNSVGFAEGYNVFFVGAGGTVGTALRTKPLVCLAKDQPTFSGMKWESGNQPRAGRTVFFKIVTVSPPPPVDILISAELFDTVLGSLGRAQFAATNLFVYTTFSVRWDPLSFSQRALFQMDSNLFSQCDAVRWQQWNNL